MSRNIGSSTIKYTLLSSTRAWTSMKTGSMWTIWANGYNWVEIHATVCSSLLGREMARTYFWEVPPHHRNQSVFWWTRKKNKTATYHSPIRLKNTTCKIVVYLTPGWWHEVSNWRTINTIFGEYVKVLIIHRDHQEMHFLRKNGMNVYSVRTLNMAALEKIFPGYLV